MKIAYQYLSSELIDLDSRLRSEKSIQFEKLEINWPGRVIVVNIT